MRRGVFGDKAVACTGHKRLDDEGMTRFAILGNCQAAYVAQCVRFMAPGCEADPYVILETPESSAEFIKIAGQLMSYQYVLAQPQFRGSASTLPLLTGNLKQISYFPRIEFTAYHPDLVYLLNTASGGVLKSVVGDYHSALAFLCYSIGLNVEQTVARFNERIFARLGYFAHSLWVSSEQNLLNSARAAGLPIERYFRSWVRRGCFMYSVNHPKLFVLADLTSGALASCGVTSDSQLCEYYVPDDLKLGAIWPVYPEIAARFGLPGSYLFKSTSSADRTSSYFDLREFVQASFDCYRCHKLTEMLCPRVEVWRADSGLINFIIGDAVPAPMANVPESAETMPAPDGSTQGKPCSSRGGLGCLDSINSVQMAGVSEISVSSEDATLFEGWAVDDLSGTVAAGVDVVVDGIPYRAVYGKARSDVAAARNPAFHNSGFHFSLGPGVLSGGVHSFTIRIIASDGRSYYEGPSGRIFVK